MGVFTHPELWYNEASIKRPSAAQKGSRAPWTSTTAG